VICGSGRRLDKVVVVAPVSVQRRPVMARLGGSSAMLKTPIGAVVLLEALGGVGLAQVAKNRCGGERGRVQELEDPFW
jgi:hypothetical protein